MPAPSWRYTPSRFRSPPGKVPETGAAHHRLAVCVCCCAVVMVEWFQKLQFCPSLPALWLEATPTAANVELGAASCHIAYWFISSAGLIPGFVLLGFMASTQPTKFPSWQLALYQVETRHNRLSVWCLSVRPFFLISLRPAEIISRVRRNFCTSQSLHNRETTKRHPPVLHPKGRCDRILH